MLPSRLLRLIPSTFGLATVILLGAAWSAPANAENCALPRTLTESTTLDPQCTYAGAISIAASGVTLDCRGATLDASATNTAVTIRAAALHDVTVRNCHINNPRRFGIMISADLEEGAKDRLPVEGRYEDSPRRVTVEHTSVTGAGRVGIYVDSYAQDTRLDHVTVSGSGGAGIYLEFSSVRTAVTGSTITGNGFGTPEQPRRNGGLREGLAIDSSSENRITGNRFAGNAGGGVFLYKNCHEHQDRPNSVRRWMPAAGNTISGNTFEDNPVGVWLASRQSRNLRSWNCGDPAYAPGYYRDHAPDNEISGNSFAGGETGVRVEDDGNKLTGNTFSALAICVAVGSRPRSQFLNLPVVGTELRANACNGSTEEAYEFLYGSVAAACEANLADGAAASCSP